MNKKTITSIAALAVCSFVLISGHTIANADTLPNENEAIPTIIPENTTLQNENTAHEQNYYLHDGNSSVKTSAVPAVRLPKQDSTISIEPTPIPEFEPQKTGVQEKTEYFEMGESVVKVISEWVVEESPLSKNEISKATDYEARTLTNKRTYYYQVSPILERIIATLDTSYTVWYYTNGRVHLYTRSLTSKLYDTDFSAEVTYGSIINTDGSASYTLGDKFTLEKGNEVYEYNIGFLVTPTTYSFD